MNQATVMYIYELNYHKVVGYIYIFIWHKFNLKLVGNINKVCSEMPNITIAYNSTIMSILINLIILHTY